MRRIEYWRPISPPSRQEREGGRKGEKNRGRKEGGLAHLISHRVEEGAEGRTEVHSSSKIPIQPVSHCGKNEETGAGCIAPGLNEINSL